MHGLETHAKDAANRPEAIHKPSPVPQSQAALVDEEGNGKAKAEHSSWRPAPAQGPSDQELKDIELSIKPILEDRNADVKQASAAKAMRSSPGASSDPVQGQLLLFQTREKQLSSSSLLLNFDQSVLGVFPNNAPLHAYEHSLEGHLQRLDAIESDGDERSLQRVREVEKSLEDLVPRVNVKSPKLQATKDVKVKGYNVEAEELETPYVQDSTAVDVSPLGANDTALVLGDSAGSVVTIRATPASRLSSECYVLAAALPHMVMGVKAFSPGMKLNDNLNMSRRGLGLIIVSLLIGDLSFTGSQHSGDLLYKI
ncbi:hypothetical protein EI94DRAFT_1707471 [Lactarius quietus]|nr:hypothetical protein EI94DRAFT_1707471 [Lactarius quietus]